MIGVGLLGTAIGVAALLLLAAAFADPAPERSWPEPRSPASAR
jgi:hypothetical protein